MGFATTIAQVVNKIIITPANPTETDTISIISDFSYRGSCAFGLVYSYTTLVDSTILIMPTYCGYWDTTLCNSVDTFKVGPFPARKYQISIDYHQGSVCPISNFDAVIHQLDTSIVIANATNVSFSKKTSDCSIKVYPNPTHNYLIIDIDNFLKMNDCEIKIINLYGRQVFQSAIQQKQMFVALSDSIKKGIYFIHIVDRNKNSIDIQRIIIE
jgi:hypothetical protein